MESKFEFYITGKKIQINISSINAAAKEEIESFLSQKNLDVKDILRAYIQKSQDYAELESTIERLLDKIPNKNLRNIKTPQTPLQSRQKTES